VKLLPTPRLIRRSASAASLVLLTALLVHALRQPERFSLLGLVLTPDQQAQRQFRVDVRNHIEGIGQKYIISGETSDGAVMFVPAEAVFAEIHAYHGEIVDFAMQRRVWIVSPTTMMAVLNTARAVLKDVETRLQVHIIKDELSKLGREFGRFDQRMKKLADHIRQAHEDAEDVRITSDKISRRFTQIERVELDQLESMTRLEQTLAEIEPPVSEQS